MSTAQRRLQAAATGEPAEYEAGWWAQEQRSQPEAVGRDDWAVGDAEDVGGLQDEFEESYQLTWSIEDRLRELDKPDLELTRGSTMSQMLRR